jgi:hypothetical protein
VVADIVNAGKIRPFARGQIDLVLAQHAVADRIANVGKILLFATVQIHHAVVLVMPGSEPSPRMGRHRRWHSQIRQWGAVADIVNAGRIRPFVTGQIDHVFVPNVAPDHIANAGRIRPFAKGQIDLVLAQHAAEGHIANVGKILRFAKGQIDLAIVLPGSENKRVL